MAVNSFFSFPSSAGQSAVAGHRPPLVLLPGWGFDGRIFELGPLPEPCFLPMSLIEPASLVADLAAFLAREGIPRIRLAGWSMGANLALDFARAHPHRLESLFLLSLRQQWPAEELAAIRRELLADPQPFLASFYRKCFAGDRPGYRRFAEGLEQSYLAAMDLPCLGRGLDYLAQSRPAAVAGVDHCQLLHGRRDIIAPVGEMATLPGATVKIYDQGGHALFLAPGFCWPESGGAIRKQAIRHRFSRAAASYEAHADVQLQVAAMLAARLPAAPVATILEIGCGSGSYTAMLADRFPHAEILALDFSPGMVEAARQRFHGTERLRFLCLDAEEFLAETDQRFDLVTSNATLQWFDHVVAALGRMAACLNPDGALLCSLFGPATLGELGQGLSAVCGHAVELPSASFPSFTDLKRAVAPLLPEITCEEEMVRRQYESLRALLLHIKKTGTGGWRSQPLLTRKRLARLDQWFVEHHGGYPATYQTFIVRGGRRGKKGRDGDG